MLYNIFGLFILWCAHIQEVQLQVYLTLTTSRPTFGRALEMRCTYTGDSPCCDSNRIWNKADVAIMTNGLTTSASKYIEEVNTSAKYFILKIKHLELSDLGQAYTCQYGFSTSATLTLTQDSTYIYPPTESCTMTNDKRRIFGTLNITKSQPSPTFVAYYKGKNWTSLLTETSPVLYDTYYYTKSATLNLPGGLTCGNDEIFILTVVTGTVETTICSVDYCKCGECAGKCYGWSTLGTVIAVIFILGGFCFKVPRLAELTTIQKILPGVGLFICSAVLNLFAIIIWKDCSCIDNTDPWFILLGLGTCLITTAVFIVVTDPNNKDAACKLFSVGLVCLVILHEKIKGKDEENPPHAKDEDHSGQKEHGKNASNEGFSKAII